MLDTKIVPNKPALLLEGEQKSLVVTDLHIGFENKLASNEIFVGKNTTIQETIDEIIKIIDSTKAESLVLLGDIKSGTQSISKNEWDEVPLFFKKMKENTSDIILIPGNHDASIERLVPDGITLVSSLGLIIKNTLLTHGHTVPSEKFSHVDKIIMGHIHPVFFKEESVVNGQRVWLSLKTEKQNVFPSSQGQLEVIVLPSFNKYFYATHKIRYKKSISPIIEKIKNKSSARIVTLDGAIIGDESMLHHVI